MRAHVLAVVVVALGCTHTRGRPPRTTCADKQAALARAHELATRTEQADGVTLRLDEVNVLDKEDTWKVVTQVRKPGAQAEAVYLVVQKRDCVADWAPIRHEYELEPGPSR